MIYIEIYLYKIILVLAELAWTEYNETDQEWQPDQPVPISHRGGDELPDRPVYMAPVQVHRPQNQNETGKSKRKSALRRTLQAMHSLGFGRPMVGLRKFDRPFFLFLNQLALLLKITDSGQEISEGWERNVGAEIDLLHSGTIFDQFSHVLCPRVDFIHVTSQRICQNAKQILRNTLKKLVEDRILQNTYLLHFMSQLYDFGNHSAAQMLDFFTVSPNYPRRVCPSTEAAIEKAQELLLGYAFCELCVQQLDSDDAIMTHINSKHPSLINQNFREERVNAREQRIIKETLEKCQQLHDLNHVDCRDTCIFLEEPE